MELVPIVPFVARTFGERIEIFGQIFDYHQRLEFKWHSGKMHDILSEDVDAGSNIIEAGTAFLF